MYLDPEPPKRKEGKQDEQNMSGFFASQLPVDAPRTRRKPRERLSPSIKQKADRFESLSNENLHGEYLPVPPATVRLVSSSPSPETPTRPGSDNDARRSTSAQSQSQSQVTVPTRPRSALLVKDTSVSHPRISAEGRDAGVSEIPAWTNEPQITDYGSSLTLVANDSGHELPKFDNWSLSSTSIHDSVVELRRNTDSRFSSRGTTSTTSRRTITPVDSEGQERDQPARSSLANTLHTLQETSPERLSTVREVPPSDGSSTDRPNSGPSDTSSQSQSASSELASSEPAPQITHRRSLKRAYSTGSLRRSPSIYNLREVSTSPSPHDWDRERSDWSAISSEAAVSPTSSPNFVSYHPDSASSPLSKGAAIHSSTSIESLEASSPNFLSYGSDSIHSTPGNRFVNNATSIESINSRLQNAHSGTAAHALNTSSSWASLDEDYDTLPPLHIPKKRARYTSAPQFDNSAFAGVGPSYVAEEMDEEIDTLPYPKRPFSSHLSTIASESDRNSRAASRHMSHFSRLSHFSLGSGVLTGDEESFIAHSPTIAERRRRSLPTDSIVSNVPSSAFDEDATEELTQFREASAVPQPLFRAGQPTMLQTSKKYDGPLPPLPPIPMSQSNEDIDTLSALPSPSLKAQKSSRSLKHQRSKSTPSHTRHNSQISNSDTDRHSAGSSIFPTWAKHFYTGNAALQSKMSLSSLKGPSRPPAHARNTSSWTDRSITSRLGTGYSHMEPCSPVSSHFLPSIFRPKTWAKPSGSNEERKLQKSNQSTKSGRTLRSKFSARTMTMKSSRSRPESRDVGRDSMAIAPHPHPLSQNQNDSTDDVLPSGQPKYGKLKDAESSKVGKQRPLPRKYSKQRLWDTMEFPRPMTKDRMSDVQSFSEPHLGPARASQQRLSTWRAPSFVESLDTLIKSRCNRQILLFMLGFVLPLFWMVGAVLPLPHRPVREEELEKANSEEDVQIAMMKHEAGDAERRWSEEKLYLKARWWRTLNRVMSVIGVCVIAAIVALVVVATA